MIIKRKVLENIKKLAKIFPAVMISGPRQCGKTTLVKNFLKGRYFDLEKPSDIQVFSGDIELALSSLPKPIIFDEAQNMPELFNVLRAVIDEERKKTGKFYLLGSVNPSLIKNISETLAGRIGIVELTPFILAELPKKISINQLWLRGGFPDALLAKTEEEWFLWQDNYISTFVERDLSRLGLNMSPLECRKFLTLLANCQGQIVNASEIGRAMGGVCYHTINRYLDIFESCFLIRRLPPYYANIGKRLVKSPKIYIRDSGIFNAICGIRTHEDLAVSHKRGYSWEGFIIEQIISTIKIKDTGTSFYFYRTQAGAEIDLISDNGKERTAIEIKLASSLKKSDWLNMDNAIKDGICQNGKIIYAGKHKFNLTSLIEAIPAEDFLIEKII